MFRISPSLTTILSVAVTAVGATSLYAAGPAEPWCHNGDGAFALNCEEMDDLAMYDNCLYLIETFCGDYYVVRDAYCSSNGFLTCEWGI